MAISLDEVRLLLSLQSAGKHRLLEVVRNTHPADLADLVERLKGEERKDFFNGLPAELASEVLAEVRGEMQQEVIRSLDAHYLRMLFQELSDDDATDIVQELSEEEAERVLQAIGVQDRRDIQSLMKYGEDTAGGVMTTELVSIDVGMTAAEAIKRVRQQGQQIQFFTVYVVDRKRILQGTVTVTDLILADPQTRIADILSDDVNKVSPETDQEEVARLLARYNLVSIPVVDSSDRLLGRVTVDDVFDIMEEEATEDLFRMSGVDEAESVGRLGLVDSVRSRLPWLCLNLLLVLISTQAIRLFLPVLERVVVLAVFLPVVGGIGGNAATQSLAVTLRRMILDGEITRRGRMVMLHESLVGLMNGLAVSLIIFAVVWFTERNASFAMVVGGATWLSITIAAFLGAMIPMVLKALKVDPAVASSVVQNFTDFIGFFLLLGLSALLLLA